MPEIAEKSEKILNKNILKWNISLTYFFSDQGFLIFKF